MSNLYLTQEKLDALRSGYKPRRPCALLKYPRPKTKPEYQNIYPWLLPDETDPHFVFCAVCECRLSAKRSDLGKHEGSIKHSENAQRKLLPPKVDAEGAMGTADIKWEYSDEENLYATNSELCKDNANEVEHEAEEEEDIDEEDGDTEAEYEPMRKRHISETNSQHSGMLDYLPLQVTINEMPNAQPAITTPPALVQPYQPGNGGPGAVASAVAAGAVAQPCRITIKKVTAPMSKLNSTATAGSHEITSKATITPIGMEQRGPAMYAGSKQMHAYQNALVAPPRDSLDLFFDSICATVKSLPPKLATEGKVRVMQLIGELELRAISEREVQAQQPQPAAVVNAESAAAAADVPSSASQQNATVASTTK